MSEPRDVGRRARWAVWLAALGACTLWLVVQNTILLAALAWAEPAGVISVGGALVRAGFVVGARCWPLVAIALGASVPFALVLRAAFRLEHREVRHG